MSMAAANTGQTNSVNGLVTINKGTKARNTRAGSCQSYERGTMRFSAQANNVVVPAREVIRDNVANRAASNVIANRVADNSTYYTGDVEG